MELKLTGTVNPDWPPKYYWALTVGDKIIAIGGDEWIQDYWRSWWGTG